VRYASPKALVSVGLAIAALGVAACGSSNNSSSSSSGSSSASSGSGNQKIALLLPENQTARYEAADRPLFEAKVKSLCPNCQVLYSNAGQDAAKQQSQVEAAITNGAKVLVLDPVDAASAASSVARAKQSNIPVLSYDRLIANADIDTYVSFDNTQVGKLQGQSLLKGLGSPQGKSIVMINGDPADNNAKLFKQGAHSVLDPSGVKIAKEYDTPGWLGSKAQTEMQQAITAVGKPNINGVYAANDTLAGASIAAMKGAGMNPQKVPVTGQDAELAGIQRILKGDQYMTVYKSYKKEAEAAAQAAVALAQGKSLPSGMTNQTVNNGQKDVPSVILTPVAITRDDKKAIVATVIKDGLYKLSQVCSGQYASACKAAGIQ
jgi:D-xylose transport system substrate-binding protein